MSDPRNERPNDDPTMDSMARFLFARWFMRFIYNEAEAFFGSELSEDITPQLEWYGYIERATYDPDKHGHIPDAEPGEPVWIWTDRMRRECAPPKEEK